MKVSKLVVHKILPYPVSRNLILVI